MGPPLARSTALIKEDGERPWVNPWHAFLELGDTISRHFRHLSENAGLASSQLMFYLIQSLRKIASIYLCEILRAREKNPSHAEEIERQLARFLAFFWSSANMAKSMSRQSTENSTECLGWIGLAFLNEGLPETTMSAARNIGFVTTAAATKIENIGVHELASMLMPLRLMLVLATEIGSTEMAKRIQDAEQKALAKVSQYPELKTILDGQQHEKLDELAGNDQELILDDAEALLLQILKQRARSGHPSLIRMLAAG